MGERLSPRPFQSHNGAIAAGTPKCDGDRDRAVSIPQWCDCCREPAQHRRRLVSRFNPTMVRLLLKPSPNELIRLAYVSIPQWCDCCVIKPFLQSICQRVSIPQWCDCCPVAYVFSREVLPVSIPQWCDCCGYVVYKDGVITDAFQSHNGAIAACVCPPASYLLALFQSHNGAIAAR